MKSVTVELHVYRLSFFLLIEDVLVFGKEDYVVGVYTISTPPNAVSMDESCIDIRNFIIDDNIVESNETLNIVLQSISPYGMVGSDSTTVIEIFDNDSKTIVRLSFHSIIMVQQWLVFAPSLFCLCPAELQVGFVNSEYSLREGTEVSVCVLLEGYVERPIDDIYVNGE